MASNDATPTLWLLPTLMSDDATPAASLPADNVAVAARLRHYVVENVRTARRFLRRCDPAIDIDALSFAILDRRTPAADIPALLAPMAQGHDMGLLSEAGCPAVADPGADLVALAQQRGYRVRPLVGPSSIVMALMASGLGGQHFTFHGYLPIDAAARARAIRDLQADTLRHGTTHIFIETPYRNAAMMTALLANLAPATRLCVATDITGTHESVLTRTVAAWRAAHAEIPRIPTIFLIGR